MAGVAATHERFGRRRYEVVWGDVLRVPYRDYEIFLPGEPAVGGEFIRAILGSVAPYDMAGLGYCRRSAESLYHLAGAIRDFWAGEITFAQGVEEHTDSVVVVDEEGNVAAASSDFNGWAEGY